MAKTTSLIGSKYGTVLSTYQKDQHLPSFHCKDEFWLSDATNTFSLFYFPVIALPDFKQLSGL